MMKRTVYALILAMLAGMLTFGGVSAQGVFEVGDEVIVQGGPLELYTQPNGGTRLTEMPNGTVTEIVAGPEMVDGVAWWYITNNYGWVTGERDGQAALVLFDPALLEQTIAETSAAIAANPNDADAYFRRGWAYFNQKAYDSAIGDLTQAITLEPDNSAFYHVSCARQGISGCKTVSGRAR
jgi:tetratricopeptide (TPR) repeat protein